MARSPYDGGDHWCKDFTTRILPVEWRVAKQSKQKGFVEPLGVAALCFTDVATGNTFKFFDFTLVSCNKKEINISGTSDSSLQTTVSIFARAQNYDQLLVLLNCLQQNNSNMYSKERIPATALDTGSISRKFMNHYFSKAAAALDARPSSSIPEIDRNRFLAVMKLITRGSTTNDETKKNGTMLSNVGTEIDIDTDTTFSQEKKEFEAIEKAMSLPFRIEAHKKLLVELGICTDSSYSNDSKMTNIQKLQAGLLDICHKEILLELRNGYNPAYMLHGTIDSNQDSRCYTQKLEAIINNAKCLYNVTRSQVDTEEDNNEEVTCEHEVVRSGAPYCGVINLSDMTMSHSNQRHSVKGGKGPLDTNHVPGSAKFLRRPAISAFNATVEEIPDLTTPL